jgi:biopolymer transport protein ExbD
MASLEISQNGKAVKGRTKRPLPRVDLTAMVDLAFLLITFFMLTTSLSKMRALDIAKPIPKGPEVVESEWPESRTMTILLGKNNQAVCYMGDAKHAVMKSIDMASIKTLILANKRMVANTHAAQSAKCLLVIIKPTANSVYKNFVDIVDEMNIAGVETYAIDDKNILVQEEHFMQSKGI